jgi:hypothetical protein
MLAIEFEETEPGMTVLGKAGVNLTDRPTVDIQP